jgi:hypothetical protein
MFMRRLGGIGGIESMLDGNVMDKASGVPVMRWRKL